MSKSQRNEIGTAVGFSPNERSCNKTSLHCPHANHTSFGGLFPSLWMLIERRYIVKMVSGFIHWKRRTQTFCARKQLWPRLEVSQAFKPTEEGPRAPLGLSWCGKWLVPQLLLSLRLNQFCNEDPAAYLQLPFNFTIFIMRVLVVWKVSVETQPAFGRVYKGTPWFSVSAVWVRVGSGEEKSVFSGSKC